ncbi:MAG: STAS domain-containing protein [Anaerolineae bacterium]|jgi:anti-anti-sigma regulatory factor
MSVSSIVAGVSRATAEAVVVRLRGVLGPALAEELPAVVQAASSEPGVRGLVLDFAAVEWLSGAILPPLAVAQARAEQAGKRLAVTGLPAEAVEAFRAIWSARALPVCTDESQALAALSPTGAGRRVAQMSVPGSGANVTQSGWAQSFGRLHVTVTDPRVPRINVEGQTVCGPPQGFGQMWRKVYRVRLEGVEVPPEDVISVWRERFGEFWPQNNRIYFGPEGPAPGAVGVILLGGPLGLSLITGILVVYSGPDAFVFVPVRGHMFCGLLAFSAYREGGTTVARADAVIRASDPLWEVAMRAGGSRTEDQHWFHTLKLLSEHFGARVWPEVAAELVDPRLHWSNVGNLLFNAGAWSGLYAVTKPLREGLVRG